MTAMKNNNPFVIKISSLLFATSEPQKTHTVFRQIFGFLDRELKDGRSVAIILGRDSAKSTFDAVFGPKVKSSIATQIGPALRNQQALELVERAAWMHRQAITMTVLTDEARKVGIEVVPLYVTRSDWADQRRYECIRNVIRTVFAAAAIPVIVANEVFVLDEFDWDHDQLACLVAVATQAGRTIFLCADGEMLDSENCIDYCKLGSIQDVMSIPPSNSSAINAKTGAAKLLTGFGIEMLLGTLAFDSDHDRICQEEDGVVTIVRPRGLHLGQLKSWIALAAASKGELEVSTFLADNLRNGRAVSILAIGVEKIRGMFSEGDIVTVLDSENAILGRGRSRISSDRLRNLMGALGDPKISINSRSEIVIHCDYFALNPELAATEWIGC